MDFGRASLFRPFTITAAIAVTLAAAIVAFAQPAEPLKGNATQGIQNMFIANRQAISPAIGMTIFQIKRIPTAICDGDEPVLCSFQRPPQSLCPPAGACQDLALTAPNGTVSAYVAELTAEDWSKSLNASKIILGDPAYHNTHEEAGKINDDTMWTWQGSSLLYSHISRKDEYGNPQDTHLIGVSRTSLR
jgi:hypothetical protein